MPGFVVAAPSSGVGKTIVTLGLVRAFAAGGHRVAPFKVGPDYIDPAFLGAAAGRACVNLDPWAMRPETLAALVADLVQGADMLIGEGVMGLFDGGPGGAGGTADLAGRLGLPVVLVVDASGMGASFAAVVEGFARHRPGVAVGGAIANRVAGEKHRRIIEESMAQVSGVRLLGTMPRDPTLALPSRHLGLVQARETADLDAVIDRAARVVRDNLDLTALARLHISPLSPPLGPPPLGPPPLGPPPLGQRIAVAQDDAFAFAYPAQLAAWRREGADLAFFSPLADQDPGGADAIYLPGGYPELHAARLAANGRFLAGLGAAARRGAVIYGECGGYMVLGQALTDAGGTPHAMAGLLPHATSFAARKLHLGYRSMRLLGDSPLGKVGALFRGHEFHYATVMGDPGPPLFAATDAWGHDVGQVGSRDGTVAGSFLHLIDRA
ncbi:MAG: cobyrinate a,c-diamide synthase [Alphaproteobacteria bacterium]|nr:cobyrinate a,c-diamide synthase [Alphaproteobacteria bacterium]